MKRLAFLAICSIAISGCASIQQQQNQAKIDQAKAELKLLNERCAGTFQTDPRLDPLRPYISFNGNNTIEQLASNKKATAKEKQAILVYDQISSECFAERLALLQGAGAPYFMIQTTRDYASAAKQAKAELWAGKYTYGQYNQVAEQNFKNSENARIAGAQAEDQRQQQAQIRQAQINSANAQANAAILSAQAQQQIANNDTMRAFTQAQQRNLPVQPVQTNCYKMGNQVNCTTY